ncbi:MAG: HDOD domain-containing protein [Planctomycetota bacterium]|nr:HDOD domain-containing protein [Planctomycetota bacterium]MDW8372929.1 HDOD domain-containing protein [Planctomycetota bacterium]
MPISRASFQDIINRIHTVPSLPEVVMQVCRLVNDPHASAAQVNAIVARDPAMAAKMLRLVNSVYYGLSEPVNDLEKAIVILGFKTVRSVALSVSVLNAFQQQNANFNMKSFWAHAVVCAALCRLLAGKTRICDPELAFIIGLLKDLGKVILAENAPEETRAIIAVAREFRLSFYAATRKLLDTDDSELCAWLMQAWNLDVDLVVAARWQYDLDAVEGKPQARLVALAQFAEYLCGLKKIRVSGDCHDPVLDQRVWGLLGLDRNALVEVLTVINDEVDNARQFLALAAGP